MKVYLRQRVTLPLQVRWCSSLDTLWAFWICTENLETGNRKISETESCSSKATNVTLLSVHQEVVVLNGSTDYDVIIIITYLSACNISLLL